MAERIIAAGAASQMDWFYSAFRSRPKFAKNIFVFYLILFAQTI